MKYNTNHPMNFTSRIAIFTLIGLLVTSLSEECRAEEQGQSPNMVQYGSMHDTIGKRDHKVRVDLADILKITHFYGVGAVAGLKGEITILDSEAIVTAVNEATKPAVQFRPDIKAAMLVGQSVPAWIEVAFDKDVAPGEMDDAIAKIAAASGVDISLPFMFVIEGECMNVRLHIINGVCPIRARMKKERISDEQDPFEFKTDQVKGTVVGVFASDSVGDLTHPDSSQHSHLVYMDPASGQRVTGHLEQYGIKKGTKLKLPKVSE